MSYKPRIDTFSFRSVIVIAISLVSLSSSNEGDEGFRSVALKIHNHFRQKNNAQPLELDQELNRRAHAHAEKLAELNNLYASGSGYPENLWSFRGELIPLAKDLEYAIKNWYTGSRVPGRVGSYVQQDPLRSNEYQLVGFGVGTSEKSGEGYSVVVAFYDKKH